MGGFDNFCAFCGGCIGSYQIGTDSKPSRALRERFIRRKRREIETGDFCETDEESGDHALWDEFDDVEDTYDPDVVSEESLEWVRNVYGIGFNPGAPGNKKVFITGPGACGDDGEIEVSISDDPSYPEGENTFTCYGESSMDDIHVIPFHWCCFEILARAITGSVDTDKIDREILYDVMSPLSSDCRDDLGLDYGNLFGREQYWESVPGEEFCVTCPTNVPGIGTILRNEAARGIFNNISFTNINLQERVANDPFGGLPYDVLHTILSFLPGKQALALMKASWPVHNATRYNEFWKRLIYWDMPWFWELHEVIEEQQSDIFDYRSFYLWLDEATTPVYGMKGPFLGIANRRRIWTSCQQIEDLYYERTHRREFTADTTYSKAIIQHSESLRMPIVLYPQPKETLSTTSKQWIYSWEEVDSRPSTFEVFFNSDGNLIGLGVTIGTSMRLFGSVGSNGATVKSRRIQENEWITGLILHIPKANLLDKNPSTAIQGVSVVRESQKMDTLGNSQGSSRLLQVREGRCLIGVTGEIGEDGVISRLGILECPRPPNDDFSLYTSNSADGNSRKQETAELPFARHHLWSSPYFRDIALGSDPRIHVFPQPRECPTRDEFPSDIVPESVLIWAENLIEVSKIERISSYISKDLGPSLRSNERFQKKPVNLVLGLRVEYIRRYWNPKRYVGIPREMDENGDPIDWPESCLQHFDIDGPGGEYVTEVEVALMDFPAAIKLRTNRDREVCFGEETQQKWDVQRAPEGERIIGLTLGFGRRSGYNPKTDKYTYLSPSYISALTVKSQ